MDFVIVTAPPLHTAFRHLKNFKGRKFCKMFRKISRGASSRFSGLMWAVKSVDISRQWRACFSVLGHSGTRKGNNAISQEKTFPFKYVWLWTFVVFHAALPCWAALWTSIIALWPVIEHPFIRERDGRKYSVNNAYSFIWTYTQGEKNAPKRKKISFFKKNI